MKHAQGMVPAARFATSSSQARVVGVLVLAFALAQALARAADAPSFEVRYSAELDPGPMSARVYVMLKPAGKGDGADPRLGPDWFHPSPFYSVEARDWKPGEALRVGPNAVGYPGPLSALEPGEYAAQAVVRLNRDTHRIGDGEGNAYGPVVRFKLDPRKGTTVALAIEQRVAGKPLRESDRLKRVEIPSAILSAFYHRPIRQRAAVVLPAGDLKSPRPTLYIVPGFGGDHRMAREFLASTRGRFNYGRDLIRVVLDPDCYTGHHVFADSATNGPRARALVEELIPYIEKHFPCVSEPGARLLNGHSSGGWSTLWLQVNYPDTFGGTWSTSPDPVDFRDFQRINLYASRENMYRDRAGERRPIARGVDTPTGFYDEFTKLDDAMVAGGQLRSFEAVFSPLGPDGQPRRLWNRITGAVDPEVARAWEAYDIRLVVERRWPQLGPKLAGKLHVRVGELDTFYLEGAVKLLKTTLERLGSDAVVEIVPDKDHSNLLDSDLAERMNREMLEAVKRFAPPQARSEPTARKAALENGR